jgi:putative transposase
VPVFEKAFSRHKRSVGKSWSIDETYIKVKGQWNYLYRAMDKDGNTVDFLLRARRDRLAARRYFDKIDSSPWRTRDGDDRPGWAQSSRP